MVLPPYIGAFENYDDRYADLMFQSRTLEERDAQIGEQRVQRKARKRKSEKFYKVMKETGLLVEFDAGV